MVEPVRSKSIPRKTRSSRGCKGTHSSNPRQGTAPREGGAVACGLVCLSTCRLRASLHEPGWPGWPGTGPIRVIWEILARFPRWQKVKDPGDDFLRQVRETKQTWRNTKITTFPPISMTMHPTFSERTGCLPFTQTTLVEILRINIKL